jgi:hypothetical protein
MTLVRLWGHFTMRVYHRIMAWIWHREACARCGNRPFESVMSAVRAYAYHKARRGYVQPSASSSSKKHSRIEP